MALKKCKECGKEISDSAKACPHCGAKSTATKIQELGCAMTLLPIFIVLLLLIIVGILSC